MSIRRNFALYFLLRFTPLVTVVQLSAPGLHADDLAAGFAQPPDSARPGIHWFWMSGNVTREGITADLEAMMQAGITCALAYPEQNSGIPAGPVKFMTPEWWDNVKHAAAEAKRLGISLVLFNGPGWSGSSGPWITPEQSMQKVVTSELHVQGPGMIALQLPRPPITRDYYRDIAVLALKVPDEQAGVAAGEVLDSHIKGFNAAPIRDHHWDTGAELTMTQGEEPQWVRWAFAQPRTLRSVTLVAHSRGSSCTAELESSDDGKAFRSVTSLAIPPAYRNAPSASFPAVTARYFRLRFREFKNASAPTQSEHRLRLNEVQLSAEPRLDDWVNKIGIGFSRAVGMSDFQPSVGAAAAFDPAEIVDVSSGLAAADRFEWDAPPGQWVLLRLGHTSTGKKSSPAPPESTGLECDKLSKTALDTHWQAMMQKISAATVGSGGKLHGAFIESWEAGQQNWTPLMREEFTTRRRYDPLRYLPALTGRVIGSEAMSERFLWDWRRTISELEVECYFEHFHHLCREHGLALYSQPYYHGNFQCAPAAQSADVPMTEFWHGSRGGLPGALDRAKMIASAAHISGQPVVAAEAFTALKAHSRWLAHPYALKAGGDQMFTTGVNRFFLNGMALQQWPQHAPGMTFGEWGSHLLPAQTWWKQARVWFDYLARCQYLLQQGRAVVDVCALIRDQSPGEEGIVRPAGLPAGYDYDACPFQSIQHMRVEQGRLVLPSGMMYRLLVLPESRGITPQALRQIRALVAAGAQVSGPKPIHSPSLQDYPSCDDEVQRIADELWGDCDGRRITEHSFGQGKVHWGKPLSAVLSALDIAPDFLLAAEGKVASISHIHRRADDADIYFIANSQQHEQQFTGSFRVSGRLPELWHPDTGSIEAAPAFSIEHGRTAVPLQLDPAGSVFVVFRKATTQTQRIAPHTSPPRIAQEIRSPWEVTFPPNWAAPERIQLEKLTPWNEHSHPGVKYFSGTATYRTTFVSEVAATASQHLFLDLGKVEVIAEAWLDGKALGTLWKPPFRAEITSLLKPGENQLEIRVTNLWPNRLIGDEQYPDDCEWLEGGRLKAWPQWLLNNTPRPESRRLTFTTWKHWQKDDRLLPSGLLGPVRIQVVEMGQ